MRQRRRRNEKERFALKSTLESTDFGNLRDLAAEAIQFAYDCISTQDPDATDPRGAGNHATKIAEAFCKGQDALRVR